MSARSIELGADVSKLHLSLLSTRNDLLAPLCAGEVSIEGVELFPTHSDPSEAFYRQLHFGEFEIAEMSLSSFLVSREKRGDMVAVPAFPGRRFMHTELYYHVDSGITDPPSMRGKRIGVAEYQQTASLWTRGILEHDFGVSQFDLEWFMERSDELSHGGATGFGPPPGIRFQRVSGGRSLDDLLVAHEIDVAPAGRALRHERNLIDKQTSLDSAGWKKIRPLFPDRFAEGQRFFQQHGFIPANHVVIIRSDIAERYPWVAFNLYRALVRSKELAQQHLRARIPSSLVFGQECYEQNVAVFGEDPFPYGIHANRTMLETVLSFSEEQGLIDKAPPLEELFAPSVRD